MIQAQSSSEGPDDLSGPERAATRRARVIRLAEWAHLPAFGIYLAYILVHFERIFNGFMWNSDASFASVLAFSLGKDPPGGLINVGSAPHYTTIWYLQATRDLPFRRFWWEASPFLLYSIGIGILAWACWKVAGIWAASLSFAIGASPTSLVALSSFTPGLRNHTWFSICGLLGVLVYLVGRDTPFSGRHRVLFVTGIGFLTGATLASDPLFLPTGLGPFLAAGILLWASYRTAKTRSVALTLAAIAVVAVGTALGLTRWMHHLGFRKYLGDGFAFADIFTMVRSTRSVGANVLHMANAYFVGQSTILNLIASLSLATLVAATLLYLGLWFFRLMSPGVAKPTDQRLTAYLAFWFLCIASVAGAYSITTFGSGIGLAGLRYLVPIFLAIAACAPVASAGGSGLKKIAAAGAALFCFLSTASFDGISKFGQTVTVQEVERASRFLEKEGVNRGYAAYWTSHAFTFHNSFRLTAYPIKECAPPPEVLFCPFHLNTRSVWYEPQTDRRTFLLSGRSLGSGSLHPSPPPGLGVPEKSRTFGQTQVFVYSRDISAEFLTEKTDS